jgi:hypothetical protein
MSSERPRMPVVVAEGGEAADIGDRPIDLRIDRNHSSTPRVDISQWRQGRRVGARSSHSRCERARAASPSSMCRSRRPTPLQRRQRRADLCHSVRLFRHCRVAGENRHEAFYLGRAAMRARLASELGATTFSCRPGSSGSGDWRRICGGPRRSVQDRIRGERRRGKMPGLRGHDRSADNREIRQHAGRYRQKSRLSLRACAQGSALA